MFKKAAILILTKALLHLGPLNIGFYTPSVALTLARISRICYLPILQ